MDSHVLVVLAIMWIQNTNSMCMANRIYKPAREYFITIKSEGKYYRLLKLEQGDDGSFYVKWNLFLAKSLDGDYNYRSYASYHIKYNEEKGGYRVHQYGCGGNRIKESEEYHKIFITDYNVAFFKFGFDSLSSGVEIDKLTEKDIFFEEDIIKGGITRFEIVLFSDKRADLLEHDCDNIISRKVDLQGYYLIVSLFKKYKKIL